MAAGQATCWPEGTQDGSGLWKKVFPLLHSLISGHAGSTIRSAIRDAGQKDGRQTSAGWRDFPGGSRPTISRFRGERRSAMPLTSTASTPAFGHGIIPGAFTMFSAIFSTIFSAMTPDRIPTGFRDFGAAMLALIILSAVPGCAKTSDLKKEQEANRIQEVRIGALERDTQTSLSSLGNRLKAIEGQLKNLRGIQFKQLENKLRILQQEQLEKFETQLQKLQGTQLKTLEDQLGKLRGTDLKNIDIQLKKLRGGLSLVKRSNGEIIKEQASIREAQERTLFGQQKMTRMITSELARFIQFRLEAENDLDKIRTRLGQMENLMRSGIARLPSKTRADKAFRQSHALIVNGELDLAADSFESFVKKYPKDKRLAEALFRRGQALFLLRKYDHALIPFFEVVEKFPQHKLASPARWMVARSLEETGDLRLARDFYAQLITRKTPYANDATRRVAFINKLFPKSAKKPGEKPGRRERKN